MAIYHLSAKTGSKAKGQSAAAKCNYISREDKYSAKADELVHAQSLHMPGFAQQDPVAYWSAADQHERSNGRLFKEVEFALPVELSAQQQIELARDFAQQLTADENLPCTLAIHDKNDGNPHCHLMISERVNDGVERTPDQWFRRHNSKKIESSGARKTESLKPKEWLENTREQWSNMCNSALEQHNIEARIDHRSHVERGIDATPGLHLGPSANGYEQRTGQKSFRREKNEEQRKDVDNEYRKREEQREEAQENLELALEEYLAEAAQEAVDMIEMQRENERMLQQQAQQEAMRQRQQQEQEQRQEPELELELEYEGPRM